MMLLSRRPVLFGLLLGLAGCASAAREEDVSAFLAPDLRYRLPRPAALRRSISVVQMVGARYREESFAFEGYLSIAPDNMTLISTDPFGRRAMTLTWGAQGPLAQKVAPWAPAFVPPENILADITLAYWPASAVRSGLAGGGAVLTAEAQRRVIAHCGRDIIDITYDSSPDAGWPSAVRFRNLAFGYELDLRSVVSE